MVLKRGVDRPLPLASAGVDMARRFTSTTRPTVPGWTSSRRPSAWPSCRSRRICRSATCAQAAYGMRGVGADRRSLRADSGGPRPDQDGGQRTERWATSPPIYTPRLLDGDRAGPTAHHTDVHSVWRNRPCENSGRGRLAAGPGLRRDLLEAVDTSVPIRGGSAGPTRRIKEAGRVAAPALAPGRAVRKSWLYPSRARRPTAAAARRRGGRARRRERGRSGARTGAGTRAGAESKEARSKKQEQEVEEPLPGDYDRDHEAETPWEVSLLDAPAWKVCPPWTEVRPVAATRKKGVVDAPGGLPKDLYLTANYLPSTTTRRRIKNIVVVLKRDRPLPLRRVRAVAGRQIVRGPSFGGGRRRRATYRIRDVDRQSAQGLRA